MKKSPMTHWKTRDGQILEIHWMETEHLAHCFNMVIRAMFGERDERLKAMKKTNGLYAELEYRRAFTWSDVRPTIQIPNIRETITQLCYLNAIRNTPHAGVYRSSYIQDMNAAIERLPRLAAVDPAAAEIIRRATEYRLSRG